MVDAMRVRMVGAGLLAAVGMLGCSRGPVVTELPEQEQHLRYVVMAYRQASTELGRAPRGIDELRPFVRDFGDPDELLRSPRDGEPYLIVGAGERGQVGYDQGPVLAVERKGVDGVHKAIDMTMTVRDVSAKDFARLEAAAE